MDKISVLEIKKDRVQNPQKIENVQSELDLLQSVCEQHLSRNDDLASLYAELKLVNERLWDLENRIRRLESVEDFGEDFVRTARQIHKDNDRRAGIKRDINQALNSELIEEKEYSG